jgi:hypothetical protein
LRFSVFGDASDGQSMGGAGIIPVDNPLERASF